MGIDWINILTIAGRYQQQAGAFQIVANEGRIFQTAFFAKPLCREERGLG